MKDWLKGQPPTAVLLVSASILLAAGSVWVQNLNPPNELSESILQGLTFLTGTAGTFIAGKAGAEEAGKAFVRPHAGSAFRRVLNLYTALGRQRQAIVAEHQALLTAAGDDGMVSMDQVAASFRALELMVVEQSSTANDAMEDWRSLVPEQVEEVEAAARERERELGDG